MNPTRFAVRNYRFVLVLTLAAVFLGAVGFLKMPRQEDPELPSFGGIVTVIYPSATPEELENRVLEPLEESIHELEDVEIIKSTAADGVAVIRAEWLDDSDKESAYDDFVQRVSAVQSELPDGVLEVSLRSIKPSSVTVLQAAISSRTATAEELKDWAEELQDRWNTLPDVKEVHVEGELDTQVQVLVDPARLANAGMSLQSVMTALASANGDLPGGTLVAGPRKLSIRPNLRFETLDEIREMVLQSVDGRPVRLGDLATVAWGYEDASYLVRQDGRPATLVTATLKEGRSVFALTESARSRFDAFREKLPVHIQAEIVLDQSEDVRARLSTFGMSLFQGAAIIVFFVALLVGWRAAVVAFSAMFLAVAISFWLLESFGISLQQMSIAGLVVVLGLLVDNAVVVFEAILLERHRGRGALEAAIEGAGQVASAITSSTATTIAAFVPMLFMAGSVGDFTRDIPVVVSVVLLVSLGVALFVTPLIASRLFAGDSSTRPRGLQPALNRIAEHGFYARVLDLLDRRTRSTILAVFLASAAVMTLSTQVGFNFFPRADDKPQLLVRVKTPQAASFGATDLAATEVEDYVRAQDMVSHVTTNVGKGNPLTYYNIIRGFEQSNFAELLVTVPRSHSKDIPGFARKIRGAFARRADFQVETKLLVQGPPVGMPVSIRIKGPDLERLRVHADELAAALGEIPGAINVSHDLKPGPPRLDLRLDPVKVQRAGLQTAMVAAEVRVAMAGATATTLRRRDEDIDVVVRVAPEGEESFDDLERLRIPVAGASPIPLSSLTSPRLASTYARIMHTDLERSVVVGADLDGRLATEIVADLMPAVEGLSLDGRETWEVIGEDEERDRAFLSMLQNVLIAMGLIYGILVLQFGSFKLPFVIFTSIPVALAGSVVGLLVGGWPFGFTAFIGLLALTGIVVNDAIVLVDRINRNLYEGMELSDAVRSGAQTRLQPILLTTLTTQAGLLPLTLFGGSMWGPLGWVVIGGLGASTVVTLVLVPALYLEFMRREVAGRKRRARVGGLATASLLLGLLVAGVGPSAAAELTLDDALSRLRANNAQWAISESAVDVSEADYGLARASRLPRLSISGNFVRTSDPFQSFGVQLRDITGPEDLLAFDPDASVNLITGEARADWQIFSASRESSIRAARLQWKSEEALHRARSRQLELDLARIYFLVRAARSQVRVQESALALVQQELDDARLRADAGRALEADVLQLGARLAEVRAAHAAATGSWREARSFLAELLGVSLANLSPLAEDSEFGVPTDPDTTTLPPRPELDAATKQLDGARAQSEAASRERWPELVASVRWSTFWPDADAALRDDSMDLAAGLRWTPWSGGEISARSAQARARTRQAEHERSRRERELRRQVEVAHSAHATAEARLDAATQGRIAATEAYRVVQLRYREGRSTLTRLLDAENARTRAESSWGYAQAELQSSRAQLLWALGLPLDTAAR
jgi:multidrug efflux pump subunit AcrB/outer membrane protein TolC